MPYYIGILEGDPTLENCPYACAVVLFVLFGVLKSRVSVVFVGAFSGVGVCHDIFGALGFRVVGSGWNSSFLV